MTTPATHCSFLHYQRGFSLVELMVAMVIGLFLSAGVIQLFLGTKQTYRYEEALARLQENGRYALRAIAYDIRMAGYEGCSNRKAKLNIEDTSNYFPGAIFGEAQVAAGHALATEGTDLIQVRRLDVDGIPLDTTMTAKDANIEINGNTAGLASGDVLAIADCEHMDLFVANAVSETGIDPDRELQKTYWQERSEVRALRDVTYFVGADAGGDPVLRRTGVGVTASELVQGIEDMEILYGEDTNSNFEADVYRIASAVVDWSQVMSVQVRLLLVSNQPNLTDGQTVNWRGAAYPNPADNRLRQVFTTTTAFRNQLR